MAAAQTDGFAFEWLEGLCDGVGSRLTGSPGMAAAIEYATRTLREAGFDKVWTEPVTVPRWVRGRESARVTAPVPWDLAILGLGGSVGTPPGGIEARSSSSTRRGKVTARRSSTARTGRWQRLASVRWRCLSAPRPPRASRPPIPG
jgi:hypothetical protein